MNSSTFTTENLASQTIDELHELTRRAAGALGVSRLWIGRCLVALSRENRAGRLGYSGAMHIAKSLGVDLREAREARRVARSLEDLPLLRREAERGVIAWTSLREIVRKATEATEEHWIGLAEEFTPTQVARIVAQTRLGEIPDETILEGQEPILTEVRMTFDPVELRIIQEAMRRMSEREGRPVSFKEAYLSLAASRIVGNFDPSESDVAKIQREAELDVAAMEAPWAAVACKEISVQAEVTLVRPSRVPHWQNPRLEFNAETRHTTPAQRTEILRRDGYRCAIPECPNHLWLQIHHIVFYYRGGATIPENLTACCGACHRNIHDGYLTLEGQAPDALQWSLANGNSIERATPAASGGLTEREARLKSAEDD